MGLFGKVPNPRAPNGGRGRPPGAKNLPRPALSPAEKAQAQYLRELKKSNPAKWAELMEIQLGFRAKPEGSDDPFAQVVQTIQKLKDAGLIAVKSAPDGTRSRSSRNDNMWSAISAALQNPTAVPEALAGVVQVHQRMSGQQAPELPPDTVHLTPETYRQLMARAGLDPETGQPIAPPASLASHVAEEAPTPPAPPLPTAPDVGETWGAFIVRVIQPLTAERAGQWLWNLRASSSEVGETLLTIARLPDWQFPLAYSRMAKFDGFESLGAWCKENPDRAMDVIHAMQQYAAAA